MKKSMLIGTLFFLLITIQSNAEMKIAPGGVTFPDNSTQTTAATSGAGVWSLNGSKIYYNNGNVGIGTDNPFDKLHVKSEHHLWSNIESTRENGVVGIGLRNDTSSWEIDVRGDMGDIFAISESNPLTVRLAIGSSGNVGIGMRNPRHLLDLGYTLGKKLAVYQGPDGNSFYGFGISSNTLEIYAGADVSDSPAMVVKKATGRVGIGMNDPKYALDVVGDIRATGSVYYGYILPDLTGTPYIKPDYVFEDGYKIMSTEEVAEHLEREKSLPWITSLKREKEENGALVDMTRMSFETVETVENLQIQIIELSKLIKALKAENEALREEQRIRFQKQQAEIEELRSMIKDLKS